MELNIIDRLNPVCEIIGLIYGSKNYEKIMKKSAERLSESGINGDVFLKRNFKVLDKYMKEFEKNMVYEEVNELFVYEEEEDETLLFLILIVFLHNQEKLKFINEMSEIDVREIILDAYYEVASKSGEIAEINSLNDILNFIDKEELSKKNKWKLMKLLSESKKNIEEITKLIEENRYAYEEAYKVVEKTAIKSIEKTKKFINSGQCEMLNNIFKCDSKFTITPTLAFGVSIFEMKNRFFIGILNEIIFKEQIKVIGNKGDLVLKLKALSDNSKLNTIALLKESPKYSLEIAENLKLSSATVSYHMSALLEVGFVSVEKKQGKVYYNLNKIAIEKFIEDLNNILL